MNTQDISTIDPNSKHYTKANALLLLNAIRHQQGELYGISYIRNNSNVLTTLLASDISSKHEYSSENVFVRFEHFITNAQSNAFYVSYSVDSYEKTIPYILRGMSKYYAREDGIKLLEYLKKRRADLFGIDGFRFLGEKNIQPDQDHSIDFSAAPFNFTDYSVDEIYDRAIERVNKSPKNIFFEFVYEH